VSTAIVIFAHGSRVEPANEAVRAAAGGLARAGGFARVQAAFLDLAHPTLDEAVTALASEGFTRVAVVPYFLTLGLHLERDLPRLVEDISNRHKEIQIVTTPPLDGHPALLEALLDRAREAES
jgi:sirohydrochlorin ferrochelatase